MRLSMPLLAVSFSLMIRSSCFIDLARLVICCLMPSLRCSARSSSRFLINSAFLMGSVSISMAASNALGTSLTSSATSPSDWSRQNTSLKPFLASSIRLLKSSNEPIWLNWCTRTEAWRLPWRTARAMACSISSGRYGLSII